MKITKRQLRRIIREEKASLNEAASVSAVDRLNDAMDDYITSYLTRPPYSLREGLDTLREEVEGYIESALADIADSR